MEVQFTPDLEAKLTQRAMRQGRAPSEFVQEVVAHYLDEEDRLIEEVKKGNEALDRGEYLTHEEVRTRLKRFLTDG
jgi:predicted transcriptional regulator